MKKVLIAHKYDVDFREAENLSIEEFSALIDKLSSINSNIITWQDEENGQAWELNRTAIQEALSETPLDDSMRSFLTKLLNKSNPELDFIRVEFS